MRRTRLLEEQVPPRDATPLEARNQTLRSAMTAPRIALVLFVALGIGLCFVVPARDLPDTAYDESESLFFEDTPVFCIALPNTHSEASVRIRASRPYLNTQAMGRAWPLGHAASQISTVSDSLITLNHLFRC